MIERCCEPKSGSIIIEPSMNLFISNKKSEKTRILKSEHVERLIFNNQGLG